MPQCLLPFARLDWPFHDYSTPSRRQKALLGCIEVASTATGLHLPADTTDIKILGEGESNIKKRGTAYRYQRRKAYLGIAPTIGRAEAEIAEVQTLLKQVR
jgi:hypothetical protein